MHEFHDSYFKFNNYTESLLFLCVCALSYTMYIIYLIIVIIIKLPIY